MGRPANLHAAALIIKENSGRQGAGGAAVCACPGDLSDLTLMQKGCGGIGGAKIHPQPICRLRNHGANLLVTDGFSKQRVGGRKALIIARAMGSFRAAIIHLYFD